MDWINRWGYPLALFMLAVLLYLPTVRNGFVYDDETLILKEARPRTLQAFTEIFDQRHFPGLPYYRPVTRLTFRVQKSLHGDNPVPYHVLNVVLAGFTAWAAFGLLRSKAFGLSGPLAALAALLFIVHPTASSCVNPICSGRETLLPSLLILLAMQAWLRAGWRGQACAVGCWALALFAKEQAIVVPVLFLLADALDLSRNQRLRHAGRELLWFGLMGAIAVGYMTLRLGLFSGSEFVSDLAVHPWYPLLSYVYAIQTAFAPFARLVYEPAVTLWFSAWRTALGFLLAFLLAWLAWRERRRIGGPSLFWLAWFVLLQLPTANLLRQEAKFDERYVFLAWLAIPGLAAACSNDALRRSLFGLLAAVLVLFWGAISFNRAAVFADDLSFSLEWAATNPHSAIALNNVGNNLLSRQRLDEAEGFLRRALAVNPAMAAAHYNLGTTLYRLGRLEDAIAEFRETLRCDPAYRADYNLALALADAGRDEEAIRHYRVAKVKEPANPDVPYNLGLMLARRGEMDPALAEFRAASRLAPHDPKPWFNTGVALERTDRLEPAMEAYVKAKTLDPRYADARFNLGNLFFRKGLFHEAVDEYAAAAAIRPDDPQFRQNLEAARQMMRRGAD
jgi:tetratricopeptide (TPR) repeat protein